MTTNDGKVCVVCSDPLPKYERDRRQDNACCSFCAGRLAERTEEAARRPGPVWRNKTDKSLLDQTPEELASGWEAAPGSGEAAFPTYEQIRDWLRAHAEDAATFNQYEAEAAPAPPGRAVDLRCAWYDEGTFEGNHGYSPTCGKPATHWSCCCDLAPCINVCEEHRCRCKQPAPPADSSRPDGGA